MPAIKICLSIRLTCLKEQKGKKQGLVSSMLADDTDGKELWEKKRVTPNKYNNGRDEGRKKEEKLQHKKELVVRADWLASRTWRVTRRNMPWGSKGSSPYKYRHPIEPVGSRKRHPHSHQHTEKDATATCAVMSFEPQESMGLVGTA